MLIVIFASSSLADEVTPNYLTSSVYGVDAISVAVDSIGRIYVANRNSYTINVVGTNQDGYPSVDGNGYAFISTLVGDGQDGFLDGLGTNARVSASVWNLQVCARGSKEVIYIVDTDNNLIREMTADGEVTTIAGGNGGKDQGFADLTGTSALFDRPQGVACDPANGDLWIVDPYNSLIRKIDYSTKAVSTMAGQLGVYDFADGMGSNAIFGDITHIAYSPATKCFYISDSGNNNIRQITLLGEVSTVAGSLSGSSTPFLDGIGTLSTFNRPYGISIDPINGNIVVGDQDNHRIRTIDPLSAQVVTIAGNGVDNTIGGLGTFAEVTPT